MTTLNLHNQGITVSKQPKYLSTENTRCFSLKWKKSFFFYFPSRTEIFVTVVFFAPKRTIFYISSLHQRKWGNIKKGNFNVLCPVFLEMLMILLITFNCNNPLPKCYLFWKLHTLVFCRLIAMLKRFLSRNEDWKWLKVH